MDNKWNFKIELKSMDSFETLKNYYGVAIPEDLQRFIIEANGSNPEKNLAKINGVERVFETVLSYNESEEEAITVFDIIKNDQFKNAVPFGMDPFGNIFYCSLTDSKVVFYNHEENLYEDANCTLEQFVSSLYS